MMAKRIVKNRELRLDARATNGNGVPVCVIDLWGNSYGCMTKAEAAKFAEWLSETAVPFLRDFSESK